MSQQPQALLLCIPIEVRIQILELSIGEHKLRFVDPDRSFESKADDNPCGVAHIPTKKSYSQRNSMTESHLFSLSATCQQLYLETQPILCRQIVLHFSSPSALCKFSNQRCRFLSSVCRIHLDCGPAKHISASRKFEIRAAIDLLTRPDSQLKHLRLDFGTYFGIERDDVILSSFWLDQICRSSELSCFSLGVLTNLPGPLGIDSESGQHAAALSAKVRRTEKILQHYLCSTKKHNHESVFSMRRRMIVCAKVCAERSSVASDSVFLPGQELWYFRSI